METAAATLVTRNIIEAGCYKNIARSLVLMKTPEAISLLRSLNSEKLFEILQTVSIETLTDLFTNGSNEQIELVLKCFLANNDNTKVQKAKLLMNASYLARLDEISDSLTIVTKKDSNHSIENKL